MAFSFHLHALYTVFCFLQVSCGRAVSRWRDLLDVANRRFMRCLALLAYRLPIAFAQLDEQPPSCAASLSLDAYSDASLLATLSPPFSLSISACLSELSSVP